MGEPEYVIITNIYILPGRVDGPCKSTRVRWAGWTEWPLCCRRASLPLGDSFSRSAGRPGRSTSCLQKAPRAEFLGYARSDASGRSFLCPEKAPRARTISSFLSKLRSASSLNNYLSKIISTENIGEVLPGVSVTVLLLNFIVETVHTRYLSTFVIPSQQTYFIRISQFQTKQKFKSFNTIIASIDKIPYKNVFLVGYFPSYSE